MAWGSIMMALGFNKIDTMLNFISTRVSTIDTNNQTGTVQRSQPLTLTSPPPPTKWTLCSLSFHLSQIELTQNIGGGLIHCRLTLVTCPQAAKGRGFGEGAVGENRVWKWGKREEEVGFNITPRAVVDRRGVLQNPSKINCRQQIFCRERMRKHFGAACEVRLILPAIWCFHSIRPSIVPAG